MFTGIIETLGTITTIRTEGTNKHFTLTAPFVHELKIDQSVSHNGVCLTVVAIENDTVYYFQISSFPHFLILITSLFLLQ